eukprot:4323211-Alexandrium_andersonii.AAC.1
MMAPSGKGSPQRSVHAPSSRFSTRVKARGAAGGAAGGVGAIGTPGTVASKAAWKARGQARASWAS